MADHAVVHQRNLRSNNSRGSPRRSRADNNVGDEYTKISLKSYPLCLLICDLLSKGRIQYGNEDDCVYEVDKEDNNCLILRGKKSAVDSIEKYIREKHQEIEQKIFTYPVLVNPELKMHFKNRSPCAIKYCQVISEDEIVVIYFDKAEEMVFASSFQEDTTKTVIDNFRKRLLCYRVAISTKIGEKLQKEIKELNKKYENDKFAVITLGKDYVEVCGAATDVIELVGFVEEKIYECESGKKGWK